MNISVLMNWLKKKKVQHPMMSIMTAMKTGYVGLIRHAIHAVTTMHYTIAPAGVSVFIVGILTGVGVYRMVIHIITTVPTDHIIMAGTIHIITTVILIIMVITTTTIRIGIITGQMYTMDTGVHAIAIRITGRTEHPGMLQLRRVQEPTMQPAEQERAGREQAEVRSVHPAEELQPQGHLMMHQDVQRCLLRTEEQNLM